MNVEDGKWNEKKFWEFTTLLEKKEWKEEADIIGNNCADSKWTILFSCIFVYHHIPVT